jgi:hypothetical protein
MAFKLASFEADFSTDDYSANIEAEFLHPFHVDWEEGDNDFDLPDEVVEHEHKTCSRNAFDYVFGNVYEAHWYKTFLCGSVREKNLIFFCTRLIRGIPISLPNAIEEDRWHYLPVNR